MNICVLSKIKERNLKALLLESIIALFTRFLTCFLDKMIT